MKLTQYLLLINLILLALSSKIQAFTKEFSSSATMIPNGQIASSNTNPIN